MNKQWIKDFKNGDNISSYFGVLDKTVLKTRTDKNYIDLTLVDSSGAINAKIWDSVDQLQSAFEQGDAVAVNGQIVEYNNELQLKVNQIRRVEKGIDEKYGFSYDELIPTTNKDIDKMWIAVKDIIESISNEYLEKLVMKIFTKYEEMIKKYPASMILHHAYRGGFLEHIFSMVNIADAVCGVYKNADRDLVITGVLLHDIGKLKELETGLTTSYSDEGNFIGHLVLGRDIVIEEISGIENFPDMLRLKLEHIILAHQGKYEWQSPREPEFLEALIVYFIDELDTRVNQMKRDIEADKSDGNWTTKKNYFHRPLYKGE